MDKTNKNFLAVVIASSIFFSSVFGTAAGFLAGRISIGDDFGGKINSLFNEFSESKIEKVVKVEEESAVIAAVEKVSPAVVSIIVTKDLPAINRYYLDPFSEDEFFKRFFGDLSPNQPERPNEKREIGGGTGFIISSDGYIVTNRHVVADEEAEYTVITDNEEKYEAKVLAKDSITDLAILKIEAKNLPVAELGDSSNLKVGQTAIAVGNSLGEFRNTVSVGVISGLSRSIIAGGSFSGTEELRGVIQTDASINPGNSGGPLVNIAGQVIGINTAMAQGAQNIGFTIPINEVKKSIESVREHGRIIQTWLGVRYLPINKEIADEYSLKNDYGALIIRGQNMTDLAVIPGSPADKAGLLENDIILEINDRKIDQENPLNKVISQYNPGDEIEIKLIHKGEEKKMKLKLEEKL